jgi:hypothetical protein
MAIKNHSGILAFHFALYKTVVALNIIKRDDSATQRGLSVFSNSGVELLVLFYLHICKPQ